jgi:glycosyltransferase involved in cell wall biosynthesis
MKIVYSLPHPADKLKSEQAGHTIRATAMLGALEQLGHEIVRVEAASSGQSQTAVNVYRKVFKRLLPRPIAMRMRDMARVKYSRGYAQRLLKVIEENQPDIILETHIAFSLAGKIASEQTGLPLVLDDVAPSWEEETEYGVGAKQLARDTHKEVTTQASMLVAVSEAIRGFLIEDGVPNEKIVTISNGIRGDLFHTKVDGTPRRNEYGIADDAIVIVFLGSFQPFHRVDLLLEAAAKLETDQKIHLFLVGGDKRVPEYEAMAHKLGLADIATFTGRIPYEDVASYIAAGDIAIIPATSSYTNPMKLYEYMALGKAVLAPRQPNVVEIATHDENAYLFEPEDLDSMIAALKIMIEDAPLREKLGNNAAKRGAENTWMKRGEILEAGLKKILSTK